MRHERFPGDGNANLASSEARAVWNALLPRRGRAALRLAIAGGAVVDKAKPEAPPSFTGDPTRIWTLNGAAGRAENPPLFSVKRNTAVVLALTNATAFPQSLHLHGHVFRLLHPLDDGWEPYWLDTFQLLEGRTARIAFLADNPGRWLVSATVLERFDTGLWGWFEVT